MSPFGTPTRERQIWAAMRHDGGLPEANPPERSTEEGL